MNEAHTSCPPVTLQFPQKLHLQTISDVPSSALAVLRVDIDVRLTSFEVLLPLLVWRVKPATIAIMLKIPVIFFIIILKATV
jgi:hypothetical protein